MSEVFLTAKPMISRVEEWGPETCQSPERWGGVGAWGPWWILSRSLLQSGLLVWGWSCQQLGWEDPLEKGKATHSSILVWRIPWTV